MYTLSFFLYILYHIYIKNTKFDIVEILARYISLYTTIVKHTKMPAGSSGTAPVTLYSHLLYTLLAWSHLFTRPCRGPIYLHILLTPTLTHLLTYLAYPYTYTYISRMLIPILNPYTYLSALYLAYPYITYILIYLLTPILNLYCLILS